MKKKLQCERLHDNMYSLVTMNINILGEHVFLDIYDILHIFSNSAASFHVAIAIICH